MWIKKQNITVIYLNDKCKRYNLFAPINACPLAFALKYVCAKFSRFTVSPVGNTDQRMGVHGPVDIPEVGSGA